MEKRSRKFFENIQISVFQDHKQNLLAWPLVVTGQEVRERFRGDSPFPIVPLIVHWVFQLSKSMRGILSIMCLIQTKSLLSVCQIKTQQEIKSSCKLGTYSQILVLLLEVQSEFRLTIRKQQSAQDCNQQGHFTSYRNQKEKLYGERTSFRSWDFLWRDAAVPG